MVVYLHTSNQRSERFQQNIVTTQEGNNKVQTIYFVPIVWDPSSRELPC